MTGNVSLEKDILQPFVPILLRQFYKKQAADRAVYCGDLSTGVLSMRLCLTFKLPAAVRSSGAREESGSSIDSASK